MSSCRDLGCHEAAVDRGLGSLVDVQYGKKFGFELIFPRPQTARVGPGTAAAWGAVGWGQLQRLGESLCRTVDTP